MLKSRQLSMLYNISDNTHKHVNKTETVQPTAHAFPYRNLLSYMHHIQGITRKLDFNSV